MIGYESNSLYHHGVKGMRWGVRKARSSTNQKDDDSLKKKLVKNAKPYKETADHKIFMDMAVEALLSKDYKMYDEIIKFDIEQGKKWVDGFFDSNVYAKYQK